MHRIVATAIMMANVMNLSMAVVAACDTVISTCFYDLVKFEFTIGTALFLESRLQKTAAAAATIVVGFIGSHFDDVLFTNNLFHHVAQIFGYRITIAFANNLAGILDGKFDLSLSIPVGINL